MQLRNHLQLQQPQTQTLMMQAEQPLPQSRLPSLQLQEDHADSAMIHQTKEPMRGGEADFKDSSTEATCYTSADNTISCASSSTCAGNANTSGNDRDRESSVLYSTISYPSQDPTDSCTSNQDSSQEPEQDLQLEMIQDSRTYHAPQHEQNQATSTATVHERNSNEEHPQLEEAQSSSVSPSPVNKPQHEHCNSISTSTQLPLRNNQLTDNTQNSLSTAANKPVSVTNTASDAIDSLLSSTCTTDPNGALSIIPPSVVPTGSSHSSTTISSSLKVPMDRPTREDVMRRLSEALLRRSLTMIDMSQRGLQSSDARLLKITLKQNSFLSSLKLGYNQLGDEGVSTLAEGIATHLNISSLDVGFNQVGDMGCCALAEAILSSTIRRRAAASTVPAKMKYITYGRRVSPSENEGFNSASDEKEGLHTLYLSGNCIGEEGASALAKVIKANCGLKRIHLTGNRVGPDGIRVLMEAMTECEAACSAGNLSLIDNDEGGSHEMNKNTVIEPKTSRLSSIMPNKNPYETTNHSLDPSIQSIPPPVPSSMKEGPFSKGNGIEELFLGGTGMGHSGCLAVAKMIQQTTSLRVLSLAQCDLGDDEVALIANAITGNDKGLPIERIQLSFNNITHKGIEILLPAILSLQHLQELQLDNNCIESRGAHCMAAVLHKVKTLTSLDLGFNSITGSGMRTLMKAVSENHQLTSLSVSGNAIDNGSAKAVAYALAHNKSLKSLFLDHCKLQSEGQRHITAGIVSNSQTRLYVMTGFLIGGNAVSLGLPGDLEKWSNEKVLKFILIMWRHMQQERDGNIVDKGIDPLLMLPGVQCDNHAGNGHARVYSGPLDPATVVSAAKRAFDAISQNESAMFVLSADCVENASFRSPLAEDAIMLEADDVHTHSSVPVTSEFDQKEISNSNQWYSGLNTPPIPGDLFVRTSQTSSIAGLDLATRKKKIVEWLCHNIHHLNDLNQLPFNSSELWRLHQHFFTPTIQESCSQDTSLPTSRLIDELSTPPGSSILSEPCNIMLSAPLSVPPGSAPVMNLNNSSGTIPMLKRKVSYRCFNDVSSINVIPPSNTINSRSKGVAAESVSKLIEVRMNGMQPRSKRARKSKSRISMLPRIRAKLDSFLDSDHQKALGLMRQLQYVEKSLLNSCMYPLNCAIIPTYLSDKLASDAEMILLDM